MKNVALLVAILLFAISCTPECSKPKAPELDPGNVVELDDKEWMSLSVQNQSDYTSIEWHAPNGEIKISSFLLKRVRYEDAGEYVVKCYTGEPGICPVVERKVLVKVTPKAPKCHPQNNTFERESATHNFTTVGCVEVGSRYSIYGRTSDNFELRFHFYEKPRPGGYLASGSTSPRQDINSVGTSFISPGGSGSSWSLDTNTEVIVSETNGKLIITICDKVFESRNNSITYKGSARLVCE